MHRSGGHSRFGGDEYSPAINHYEPISYSQEVTLKLTIKGTLNGLKTIINARDLNKLLDTAEGRATLLDKGRFEMRWESFFETSEPNAQASFKVGEERELITFEMFKPKFNNKKQRLSFKIDAEIINNRESDLVTGLKGNALDEVTLFIDDATIQATNTPNCFPNCQGENLVEASLNNIDLSEGKFDGSNLVQANLSETNLSYSSLIGANLVRSNLTNANLTPAMWDQTICPDGTMNSGSEPCTAEQLNLA